MLHSVNPDNTGNYFHKGVFVPNVPRRVENKPVQHSVKTLGVNRRRRHIYNDYAPVSATGRLNANVSITQSYLLPNLNTVDVYVYSHTLQMFVDEELDSTMLVLTDYDFSRPFAQRLISTRTRTQHVTSYRGTEAVENAQFITGGTLTGLHSALSYLLTTTLIPVQGTYQVTFKQGWDARIQHKELLVLTPPFDFWFASSISRINRNGTLNSQDILETAVPIVSIGVTEATQPPTTILTYLSTLG